MIAHKSLSDSRRLTRPLCEDKLTWKGSEVGITEQKAQSPQKAQWMTILTFLVVRGSVKEPESHAAWPAGATALLKPSFHNHCFSFAFRL